MIEFGRTVALYEEFIICGNEIRLGQDGGHFKFISLDGDHFLFEIHVAIQWDDFYKTVDQILAIDYMFRIF